MSNELADHPMSKERPKTLSVKLPMDVIEQARVVAAVENVTISDLLAEIIRPVLARREQEALARRVKKGSKG